MNVQRNNYLRICATDRVRVQDVNSRYQCEMHKCLRFSMRMSRWAGFFPVEGLEKSTLSGTRYTLKGYYSIYYALTVAGSIISTILLLLWLIENELSLTLVSDFVFSATGTASMLMMARLAKHWPTFMNKIARIERQLQEIRTSNRTDRRCNRMACIIMSMALVEHFLSMIYGMSYSMQCTGSWNRSSEVVKTFFDMNAPYYLKHVSYSVVVGLFFKIINIQATFLWSYTDVLTICFSIYLISYFQDLNKVINNRQNNLSWERLRVHYSHIVELVMEVDTRLSGFILQSFVTYIFYICLQLFHTLKSTPTIIGCDQIIVNKLHMSPEYLTYYVFSFLFLVLRFVVTSLLAANVSLVAKMPLIALNKARSSEYSIEVRRFRLQIIYTPVAMSGLFFFVTRPVLLKVVGSIITYELVMLQLH